MEIFNVGGGEFLIIILVALILFKPEDIYKLMRSVGRYAGKARRMWNDFMRSVEQEIPDDLREEAKEIQQLGKETQQTLKEIGTSSQALVNDAVDDLNSSAKDANKAINTNVASANAALKETLVADTKTAQSVGGDNE